MAPEESPPTDPMDDAEGAESLSMEEINSLLAKEDPRFVEGLKDIGELKAPEGMKIELLGIEEEGGTQAAPTSSLWARLRKLLREPKSLGAPLKNALHGLVRSSIQRKNKVKAYFKALSPVARRSLWLMFFCLAALAGSLASLGRLDLRSFLGQVEIRDLREVASETFYFDQTGPKPIFQLKISPPAS